MQVLILDSISYCARVQAISDPSAIAWVNSAWLDGDVLRPRFESFFWRKIDPPRIVFSNQIEAYFD